VRILIVNKYYFMKGGAERYLFNIKPLLEARGHTVVPLTIRFARNEPTPYARYFLDPPAGEGAVQLEQFSLSLTTLPRMILTAFYSPHAKARVRQAIRQERIDLVYALNISNYISPSIIDAAHAEGVPFVHRLSDFHLVCPDALFYRPGKDRCLDCFPGKYWHGVLHRCIGGSLGASLVRSASMFFHDAIRIYHRVDSFVCSNPFMRDVLGERGFDRTKLNVIPTPIDAGRFRVGTDDDGSFLYAGRISREKGLDVLVEAAGLMQSHDARVVIVGDTASPYAHECMDLAARRGARVEFLGPRYGDELRGLLARCRASVLPSRWIDNLPNAALESFAAGKPVVGTDVEGVRTVVHDGETGLLAAPGDAADLAAKLDALAREPDTAKRMGQAARRFVEEQHSPEKHCERLTEVFRQAIARRRAKR